MRPVITLILTLLVAFMPLAGSAFQLTPLPKDSLVVELTTRSDSRQSAIEMAKREAILGSIGRVFLEEKLLMADEILVKYISNYANQFVDGVEVTSEDFLAGENIVTARVYVDYRKLISDLTEKRFIYEPAYKPRFSTFMTEVLNDEISNDGIANVSMTLALENLGMRPFPSPLQTPPSSTDILADDFLLNAAVVSAQRSGVEIIISGTSNTTLKEQKRLYFDEYWFYETEVTAKLIRVDTQQILASATAKGSASEKDQEEAISLSIDRANALVARELFSKYQDYWPVVVQLDGDYEVLFTGVSDELLSIIEQNINRLGRNVEVFTRRKFDKSAVLTIQFDGTASQLVENLNSCPYPTLYILNPDDQGAFEVQVSP